MYHEFNDPIEVDTPLGRGRAILIFSSAHDNYWTVILSETLAIVDFPQKKLRACRNYTAGLKMSDTEMKEIIK